MSNFVSSFIHKQNNKTLSVVDSLGNKGLVFVTKFNTVWKFIVNILLSLKRYLLKRACFRKIDLWTELEKVTVNALPIVFLISFIIGVILAFVGHMQLNLFGAEIYVAALLAISTTRILAAIMTGIIMSGRTGAAYAAEIGAMNINQEIDALKTMGISPFDFLILPRVLALTIAMPILTIISDIVMIFGGFCIAMLIMNVSITEYWNMTLDWLTANNFIIGIIHGYLYGWAIAIVGCFYGMHTEKNSNGLGNATTRAVVVSIVCCIIITAILTVLFNLLDI